VGCESGCGLETDHDFRSNPPPTSPPSCTAISVNPLPDNLRVSITRIGKRCLDPADASVYTVSAVDEIERCRRGA
jgi:hypothetical protein